MLAGTVLAAGAIAASSAPAHAAVAASFSNGVLTVTGDSLDNNVTVSRNAAGAILVDDGVVAIVSGRHRDQHQGDQPARHRRQ